MIPRQNGKNVSSLAKVCIMLLWLFVFHNQAIASEVSFDIPNGQAVDSLRQLALQGELQIVFSDSVVEGIETQKLQGFYDPLDALNLLLMETPLVIMKAMQNGTIVIAREPNAAQVQGNSRTIKNNKNPDSNMNKTTIDQSRPGLLTRLFRGLSVLAFAVNSVNAQNEQDDDILELSPFEVNTISESEYQATSAVSAHVAELALTEIPLSLNVLTGDFLEDLGAFTTDDLGIVIPGGSNVSVPDGETRGLRLRGFNSPTFTNSFSINPRLDSFWIERVEVAKGPQAVLYGSGASGGAANFLFKKPKFADSNSFTLGVGDNDYFRAAIDVNQQLNDNFAVRILGHQREIGSQVDFDIDEDTSILGSVRGKFLDDRLIFDVSYGRFESQDNNARFAAFAAFTNALDDPQGRFAPIPDSDSSRYVIDKFGLGVGFNHGGPQEFIDYTLDILQAEVIIKVSDDLTFRGGFADYESELHSLTLASPALNVARTRFNVPTSGVTNPINVDGDVRSQAHQATRFDLLYEKTFLGMDHKIVASVRQERQSGKNDEWSRRRVRVLGQQADIDRTYMQIPQQLIDIVFGTAEQLSALNESARGGGFFVGDREINGTGNNNAWIRRNRPDLAEKDGWTTDISIADHIKFWDGRANVLAGISRIETGNGFDSENIFSAGTIVEVTDGVHAFYNFSQDFSPVRFIGESGNLEENTTEGEGWDIGLRLELLEGKLNASIAYFYVERARIPRRFNQEDDPNTPEDEDRTFFVLSGGEENTGVEFTLDFNPTKNWNINVQGSFSDPKIVSNISDPRLEGQPFEDTIPNAMVFGTRYEFDDDNKLGGVTIGLNGWWRDSGLVESRYVRRFRETTEHEIFNFFVSKDISLFDGKVDTTLRLDIQNILDEDDAIRSQGTYQRGRVIFASAKFNF